MSRRPACLFLLMIPWLGVLCSFLGGSTVLATGNLEVRTQSGSLIANRTWHANSFPIRWRFHDPATIPATCNYASTHAPAATLLQAIANGFATWQGHADSTLSFTYGGTTPVRAVGADGLNVVTFCAPAVLSSDLGFLAEVYSTALTVSMTVTPSPSCQAGQGLLDLNGPPLPAGFCFPVGTYPAGTIVDADIRFNTYGTNEDAYFSTDGTTPGFYDIEALATHEVGHTFGLSHDPIHSAVMYPFLLPTPDGIGQRVPGASDRATAARYYPEPSAHTSFGSITGRITLDGVAADAVHVVAIDPATMMGVAGTLSISRFEDWTTTGTEGPDFAAHGAGFYRIEGLPPGDYFVYAEYFDNSEWLTTRLSNRYNSTVGNSNVSNGNGTGAGQVSGWLGFLPALTEFYDSDESDNGGDGISAGTAFDNSDEATRVPVEAGAETSGIDIEINIEPANGDAPADRQNPTGRVLLPNDDFQGTDSIVGFRTGYDDNNYWAVRFPASLLPQPPYNIAEGLWVKGGRNLLPYVNSLVLGSSADPEVPDLIDPLVASAGRVLTGGRDGRTEAAFFMDVRDQWNVTINEPRDVWIVLNQPPEQDATGLFATGHYVITTRTSDNQARVGRTRLTLDGGLTWWDSHTDVFYDLVTEKMPPVMITAASPDAMEEGHRAVIEIHGTGFEDGAALDMGPGIVIESLMFVDAHILRAAVTASETGATAPRGVNVTLTNPGAVFPNVSRVFRIDPSTNRPPVAAPSAPGTAECTSPLGALVALDGSGSSDRDSSLGSNDDIVSFEWFEDFGLPTQSLLGAVPALGVQFGLGAHALTLRVTDTHNATATGTVQVIVEDTTPPAVSASLHPTTLWPPNHMMVGITATVTASDLCGPAAVVLAAVQSSELDDAAGSGDGHTDNDIREADVGTPDLSFAFRAERQGAGSGRLYTARYLATDAWGNSTSAAADATVPHSENRITEPLTLTVVQTAAGTLLDWDPVAGALFYNVIRGRISSLADTGPEYDLGPVRCLGAGLISTSTSGLEDSELPPAGESFFYLTEYHDGWSHSYGIESAAKPRRPGQGACQL